MHINTHCNASEHKHSPHHTTPHHTTPKLDCNILDNVSYSQIHCVYKVSHTTVNHTLQISIFITYKRVVITIRNSSLTTYNSRATQIDPQVRSGV